jgi:hypothetical protein
VPASQSRHELLPGHARGAFAQAFGTEWFIEHGKSRPAGAPFGDDLFVRSTGA